MTIAEQSDRRGPETEGLGFRSLSFLDRALLILLVVFAAASIASNAAPTLHFGSVEKLIAAPFIVVAFYSYRNRIRTRLNIVLACLFAIVILSYLSYYWSIAKSISIGHATVFLFILVGSIAEVLALKTLGGKGVRAVGLGLMIGGGLSCAQVLWAESHHTFVNVSAYEVLAQRVTAGNANPNDVAITLAMVAPIFLFSRRTFVRLAVIPLGVATALTGSRTGLFSFAAVMVGVLLIPVLLREEEPRKRQKNRRTFLQGIAASVVTIVIAGSVLPAAVLQRFSSISTELSGGNFTGRTILWGAAWRGFLSRPLLGFGSGSAPTYELRTTGYFLVTHQTMLSFLLEIGLVGGILFVIAYIEAIRGAFRQMRGCPWLILTIFAMTVGMSASAWDYNKIVWLILVLAGFLASVGKNELFVGETTMGNPTMGHTGRPID